MNGFSTTEEQEFLRESVRRLVTDKVAPRAAEIDETAEFPWDVYRALVASDFHAIHIPEAYGGAGGDAVSACIVIEEIARACASSSLIPAVNKLGTVGILLSASEELKQRYLPEVARGDAMFSYALSEPEAVSLRTYLKKGGFMIVDDFRYQHWGNFESQIMRVLPEAKIFDMELSNPIFHSFFEIRTLDVPQYYDPPPAIFRAIYEDNDPAKRILVMINYNTDISEFWEWSDTGLKPIDESNEAYKLGVNYIIYGMTH